MIDLDKLSGRELYSDAVINAVMDEPDPVTREQLKYDLMDHAEAFGPKIVKRVEQLLKIAEKDLQQKMKGSKSRYDERYTDFGDRYPALKCKNWIADMNGVYNPDALPDNRLACPHPILPVELITNVEDGMQKMKIAFYRNGRWTEQIVKKSIISSRNKITDLSDLGILVSTETAKALVKYIADIESSNFDVIPEMRATAKMGWTAEGFMPFDSDLIFDRDGRFDSLFATLSENGKRDTWMAFVKGIRSAGRIEPRLVMAASFASVLLKVCGLLPFWVDIWGRTGGGKSICGMLAASIWADPEIGKYIAKFDSTAAAFESKANFLNHLPMVIDDTAELRKRYKDDFSELIYRLASGEGKSRSNTRLGLSNKATWNNIIICSGESPIITDSLQGGAVNRVLEYETDEGDIFPDGQYAATLLRNNYGFAGREFVQAVTMLGFDRVLEMQQDFFNEIKTEEYEEKQLRSLSVLLTADRIAADNIFKDGIYLTFEELKKILTNKGVLSENARCYEYIVNTCAMNSSRFEFNATGGYQGEVWGKYFTDEKSGIEYLAVGIVKLREMCKQGGFSDKAFLSWAVSKDMVILSSGGNPVKTVKAANGRSLKCCVLKLPDDTSEPSELTDGDDLAL